MQQTVTTRDDGRLEVDLTASETEGQFLTFMVENGEYGIEIRYVTEIIGVQDITSVPYTYHYVKGIINLRGTIVTVIDMRSRFNLPEIPYTDRTCIIVLSMDDMSIGLIVDSVVEVANIDDDNIKPPPRNSNVRQGRYVRSIGYVNDRVMQLLDIEQIFEVSETQMKM